jgi:hypothetical protein
MISLNNKQIEKVAFHLVLLIVYSSWSITECHCSDKPLYCITELL